MIERFFQVLKEQLLWLREFEDEDDLPSPSAHHHMIPRAFVFDRQRPAHNLTILQAARLATSAPSDGGAPSVAI